MFVFLNTIFLCIFSILQLEYLSSADSLNFIIGIFICVLLLKDQFWSAKECAIKSFKWFENSFEYTNTVVNYVITDGTIIKQKRDPKIPLKKLETDNKSGP